MPVSRVQKWRRARGGKPRVFIRGLESRSEGTA